MSLRANQASNQQLDLGVALPLGVMMGTLIPTGAAGAVQPLTDKANHGGVLIFKL